MQKLLSLPPNLVKCFHEITGLNKRQWFCTNDPVGHKLGSGGGTAWLLLKAFEGAGTKAGFDQWLASEKRILIHAGGQSRRLPAYAPSGKVLTPIPVFRWERGQRLSQDLLSLQTPLYERIMQEAPQDMHTMVVSGDVLIRATQPLQPIPEADVVCYGLWLGPEIAKDHGVFVSSRNNPATLEYMLQKPTVEELGQLQKDHLYLTDIGIWLFSDRAVKVLMHKAMHNGEVADYDMYTTFGGALGAEPRIKDPDINALSVAILPLPGGAFYHFGTSHEIISSMLAIQNVVNDQRELLHHSIKPHPAMFVQNSEVWVKITSDNKNLWIENSCVAEKWQLAHDNIITGVPQNDWNIKLEAGQCIDIVPIGENEWAVRPYGFYDKFRGQLSLPDTLFMGKPFGEWASRRGINIDEIDGKADLQTARIFPVVDNLSDAGLVLRWMLNEPYQQGGQMVWREARKMSAEDISACANLVRLAGQRSQYRAFNWPFLARNYQHSVFYQTDLDDAAHEFADNHIAMPTPLPADTPLLTRIHDAMFRSELQRLNGKDGNEEEQHAFSLLREGLTSHVLAHKQAPHMDVFADQIVWARSPVRIDLAGGWTDTPPYCLMEGGNVVNIAIELNGQQPLQTYVKPCREPHIVLRSIDMGASETIETYEQLDNFNTVKSPFSIPKAALVLAGFHPGYSQESYASLRQQLEAFGHGIEISTLSAIPAGSGLGTSSILAATVLGALSDFCGLRWDKEEIGLRTLVLEQMLTTGGGWQDQYGGLLQGVKLLTTRSGFKQTPHVRWLPTDLFTQPQYAQCHLLYYTGITRTAKSILAEIVRRMFLNQHDELEVLRQMKSHAMDMYDAIQTEKFSLMGRLIGKTWQQNQRIDSGTNPEEINRITRLIDDYCLGYKLPGAGGGGYLYMVAKDADAATRIRETLNHNQTNANARFVDMKLSEQGLQVSRS